MAILIDHYPDDVELRLLMAKPTERDYEKGEPTSGAIYSRAMLRDILHDYPDNAAANHYWIHAIEPGGHPERALESAEKLAKLAPASGHMVHMPGHISIGLAITSGRAGPFLPRSASMKSIWPASMSHWQTIGITRTILAI
jgi:hypothetical protein